MRVVQFNHEGLVIHCVAPEQYGRSREPAVRTTEGLRRIWECAAFAELAPLGTQHSFLLLADDDPRQPNPGDRLAPVTGAFAPCPVWTAAKAAQEQAERDDADAAQRRSDALDALLAQAAK